MARSTARHTEQLHELLGGQASDDLTGKVGIAKLRGLLIYQDFKCALTGRQLTPDNTQGDHKQPVSKGGGADMENLQLVHVDVNQAKGAMDQGDFVKLCCEVAAMLGGMVKRSDDCG